MRFFACFALLLCLLFSSEEFTEGVDSYGGADSQKSKITQENKIKSAKTKVEKRQKTQGQTEQMQTESEDDLQEPKSPAWVHSIGLLTTYFDDGTLKQGFGILLRDGHFVTATDLIENNNSFPKSIYVKMQDDSAKPLICIAMLEISAVDVQKGLALLRTVGYTDEYCNVRSESFYHKRIFDLYYLDIFSHPVPMNIVYDPKKQDVEEDLFFPLIRDQYTFSVGSIDRQKRLFYYGKGLDRDLFYAYGIKRNFNVKIGDPFFDEKGNLVGIYARTSYYKEPVIVHSNIIKSFLCNLQADYNLYTWNRNDCKIFQHNLMENIKDIIQNSGLLGKE